MNIITPENTAKTGLEDRDLILNIKSTLKKDGWLLLRGFNVNVQGFSDLIIELTDKLTFDPAREHINKDTQKVDAGMDAIGLHIENGNTPVIPDIVAFYSKHAAQNGSQTTVCDGTKVINSFSIELQEMFNQTVTVTRRLSHKLWKQYILNLMPELNSIDKITPEHLDLLINASDKHQATLNSDMSIDYSLKINPVRKDNLNQTPAFANAILGPSYNYEAPVYTFDDGTIIDAKLITELEQLCEKFTIELNWQDNDIAIIDNKRVMHGRREIEPNSVRELHIAMGIYA